MSAAPAPRWMTETRLHEILCRNYGDVRLPALKNWTLTVAAIQNYQRAPWENQAAGTLAAGVRKMQRERITLDSAAKILEADAALFFQNNPEWQRRYAEAVQMLRMARAASDNSLDHLSKVKDRGPSMTGWAYTARQIMAQMVPILMQAQAPVSSRHTSPFVKSLLEILGYIYPPDRLPSAATLSKAVAKYLDE